MPNSYDVGICTKCKEWTELGDPCCGYGVEFEGDVYSHDDEFDDLEPEESLSLEQLAENAAELRRECEKDEIYG